MTKKINPSELLPFSLFIDREPIQIDLVYADANHPRNIFETAIYQPTAQLWAHKDIAAITLLTARILNKKYGWVLELKDCLRTVEAQAAMQETDIVKAHPEWCIDGPDRMLSPPGLGAHPRAMAIDVCVFDKNNEEVNMGTPFDHMGPESARNYQNFSKAVLDHRKKLEDAFILSAKMLALPLYLVASEWWDFRLPAEIYNKYSPLSDADLPEQMQMTKKTDNNISDFGEDHFQRIANSVLTQIGHAYENL
ncbi:MAG: M15 family metallopeptidase [Alphaproteobacteria bacterium]|nr:M15 family metallopeptidase [Alphaproteobacteria bacterium]